MIPRRHKQVRGLTNSISYTLTIIQPVLQYECVLHVTGDSPNSDSEVSRAARQKVLASDIQWCSSSLGAPFRWHPHHNWVLRGRREQLYFNFIFHIVHFCTKLFTAWLYEAMPTCTHSRMKILRTSACCVDLWKGLCLDWLVSVTVSFPVVPCSHQQYKNLFLYLDPLSLSKTEIQGNRPKACFVKSKMRNWNISSLLKETSNNS